MRITGAVVARIAADAEEFTEGAFVFQGVGGDIGHGARYLDGVRQLAWVGRGASQEAAMYYIGGMLGWARESGREIPDEMREYAQSVQAACRRSGQGRDSYWQEQGETDGQSRARKRVRR